MNFGWGLSREYRGEVWREEDKKVATDLGQWGAWKFSDVLNGWSLRLHIQLYVGASLTKSFLTQISKWADIIGLGTN